MCAYMALRRGSSVLDFVLAFPCPCQPFLGRKRLLTCAILLLSNHIYPSSVNSVNILHFSSCSGPEGLRDGKNTRSVHPGAKGKVCVCRQARQGQKHGQIFGNKDGCFTDILLFFEAVSKYTAKEDVACFSV